MNTYSYQIDGRIVNIDNLAIMLRRAGYHAYVEGENTLRTTAKKTIVLLCAGNGLAILF